MNDPASAISAIRSRANIFPLAAADSWYLAAPPRSIRSRSAPTSGSEESTISVTLAERTGSAGIGTTVILDARHGPQPLVLDQLEQRGGHAFHVRAWRRMISACSPADSTTSVPQPRSRSSGDLRNETSVIRESGMSLPLRATTPMRSRSRFVVSS